MTDESQLADVRARLALAEAELDRQQRFTEVLLDTVDVGIVFCDADGDGWVRNRAERRLLGIEPMAQKGVSPHDAATRADVLDLNGEPVAVADYPILRALRGEVIGAVGLLLGPAGGPHREVISHTARIVGAGGDLLGAVSTLTDVSEERQSQRALADERASLVQAQRKAQHAEAQFRKIFDQAGIGAVILDLACVPTLVNAAACVVMERSPEQLTGSSWERFLAPGQVPLGLGVISHLRAGNDTFTDERRYLRPDGSVVWVSMHISLVNDEHGEPDYLLAQIGDITDRKRMESDLDHLALHDVVTGLPNRSLFAERVRQALVEPAADPVAVVVLVVGGLTAVIDRDGYAAGDFVTKEIALRLADSLSADATIGHLQPGLFAVLVRGGSAAVRAAEQALATVGPAIVLPTGAARMRASVGICATPPEPSDPEAMVGRLIQDATTAAGPAKLDGPGRIAFASQELRREQEYQHRTELLVRDALDRDEVRVAYQPVLDLASGHLVGVEALLRISDDLGRPMPPQELIAVAEQSGLIIELGTRVLRLAAAQSARWHADHDVLVPVAVNVSVVQLESEGFIREVLAAAAAAGVPPEALSIELTESVLLESGSVGIQKLHDLNDAGIKLAIDDFGTGYASLSYLRELPASTLKIDRSFVEGIPHDHAAVAIVASVIGLARNFGMTCIAEGIETEAQLAYLAERRVHGQGYLLGRPGESAAIDVLLSRPADLGDHERPRSEADDRDEAGDERDARADLRDDAAAQRDHVAESRDEAGAARDEVAEVRETSGAQVVALRGAAEDRARALEDREAGASERDLASADRAAALTDRDAGASERHQAELDRNIALADRGPGGG